MLKKEYEKLDAIHGVLTHALESFNEDVDYIDFEELNNAWEAVHKLEGILNGCDLEDND
jgi:hypothetical protein